MTRDPGRTLLLTRASPGLPVVARQTPSNYYYYYYYYYYYHYYYYYYCCCCD